jgi:hypothetical protein
MSHAHTANRAWQVAFRGAGAECERGIKRRTGRRHQTWQRYAKAYRGGRSEAASASVPWALGTNGANDTRFGTFPITIRLACAPAPCRRIHCEGELMNGLIYLVGLIVVIMAILSLFGLR